MIVVTGASGQLGRAVVDGLLQHRSPQQIVAAARSPEKVEDLAGKGVRVRAVDFTDAATMADGFAGADQVLVISVNALGEAAREMHRSAIRAVRAAGARRVLYTSHMGARADSPFAPAFDHAAAEAVLAEGGAFTALRHGFYAESALHMIGSGLQDGEIRVPEDGPVCWTARADLAAADALLLNEEGLLDGVTPALTASEALTMGEIAEIASELTGREIKRVTLTDDDWRDAKVKAGVPAPIAELLLGSWRAARRGDFANPDPTLKALLGRPPRTMRDALAAALGRAA